MVKQGRNHGGNYGMRRRVRNDLNKSLPIRTVTQIPDLVLEYGKKVRVLSNRGGDQGVVGPVVSALMDCDCRVVVASVETEVTDWADFVIVLWSCRGAVIKRTFLVKCFYIERVE